MALILPHSVFLHVPKTGGTWCRSAIRRAGIPHFESGWKHESPYFRAHHPLDRVRAVAGNRFLFGFVRDPLDWWRSFWGYRMRHGWGRHPVDHSCRADEFDLFMRNVAERLPGWCSSMYRQFVGPRHQPIHFVGLFENLANDLIEALRLAGERFDEHALRSTPPENVNNYSRWPAEYTPSLYQAIRFAEQEAIDRFDY
jgi:hypothetical protein